MSNNKMIRIDLIDKHLKIRRFYAPRESLVSGISIEIDGSDVDVYLHGDLKASLGCDEKVAVKYIEDIINNAADRRPDEIASDLLHMARDTLELISKPPSYSASVTITSLWDLSIPGLLARNGGENTSKSRFFYETVDAVCRTLLAFGPISDPSKVIPAISDCADLVIPTALRAHILSAFRTMPRISILGKSDDELIDAVISAVRYSQDLIVTREKPLEYITTMTDTTNINKVLALINDITRHEAVDVIRKRFGYLFLEGLISDDDAIRRVASIALTHASRVDRERTVWTCEKFLTCFVGSAWWIEVEPSDLINELYVLYRTIEKQKKYNHIASPDKGDDVTRLRDNARILRTETLMRHIYEVLITPRGTACAIVPGGLLEPSVTETIRRIIQDDEYLPEEKKSSTEGRLSAYLITGEDRG